MAHASLVCAYVVASWVVYPPPETATETCEDIAAAAMVEGVPVELAVALAYTESRLNPKAKSRAGALGPLQVIPRWHCPDRRRRGCDLVAAGVRALVRYRAIYGPWRRALCHWNSGNVCVRRSKTFAEIVLRRASELQSVGNGLCGGGGQ